MSRSQGLQAASNRCSSSTVSHRSRPLRSRSIDTESTGLRWHHSHSRTAKLKAFLSVARCRFTEAGARLSSRVVFDVMEKGPPSICYRKPLMSFVDALEVLRGNYPRVGHTLFTPSGRKRKFGGIDTETLRQIHEEFTETALKDFGIVPSLELREGRRIHQWYKRWRSVKHRIEGNRFRNK